MHFYFYGVGPKWNYKIIVIYVILKKLSHDLCVFYNMIEIDFVEVKIVYLQTKVAEQFLKFFK